MFLAVGFFTGREGGPNVGTYLPSEYSQWTDLKSKWKWISMESAEGDQ